MCAHARPCPLHIVILTWVLQKQRLRLRANVLLLFKTWLPRRRKTTRNREVRQQMLATFKCDRLLHPMGLSSKNAPQLSLRTILWRRSTGRIYPPALTVHSQAVNFPQAVGMCSHGVLSRISQQYQHVNEGCLCPPRAWGPHSRWVQSDSASPKSEHMQS